MTYTYSIAFLGTLLVSGIFPYDSAAASNTCEELVTACFVSAPEARDECIQTSSTTEVCETSPIHTLVMKRAQFAPTNTLSQEGPAFLGPQIVDQRCVAQFDTAWSAALVNGSTSKDSVASLSAALDRCARVDIPALPHL
jgi:hypothetical protein